ncbi:MAG: hypothetical protein ACTSQJ_17340 [Promethearchaeota archaeon]
MEKFTGSQINSNDLIKKYYKPSYMSLFNKIKKIQLPVKNEILMALLDGQWHSETELVRIAKKKQYMGVVTLGTMISSLNQKIKSSYLERQNINGEMYYKISENYIGLTRAAYSKYRLTI